MKSSLSFLMGALCLLAACASEDEIPETCSTPEAPPNYFPLAVGNYWIYDWSKLSEENSTKTPYATDTLRVTGVEEISGKEYFRLERSQRSLDPEIEYRRDSLEYVIDEKGRIIFSRKNPGSVFQTDDFGPVGTTPVLSIEYSLKEEDEKVEVKAGTFNSLVKIGRFIYPDPEDTDLGRSIEDKYTAGVGVVEGTRRFAQPSASIYYAFQLVDYNIEE